MIQDRLRQGKGMPERCFGTTHWFMGKN
jgi:hypothetical protein